MSNHATTLLVVDDEPYNLEIISEFLESEGYELVTAQDGREALDILEREPKLFSSVILDRMMPGVDGIAVLQKIKSDPELRLLPVIMQTAAASREQILEGLQFGAYYYLTKPFEPEMLASVVRTAVRDHSSHVATLERVEVWRNALGLVTEAKFELHSLEEARNLAAVIADRSPNPNTVTLGLTELLINAVEHGNLGITYADKSRLLADSDWEQEVTRRLALPENAAKRVRVEIARTSGSLTIRIADDGEGFDWQRYLEMDPSRVFDSHGRGIAMARKLSFSEVSYLGCGNELVARVDF
jgi:CheY-like chemotaxis protein/anti-sigma regulatory factor (Ser/Thr protein kinase)